MKQTIQCFLIFRKYAWEESGVFIIDSYDYRKSPNDTHFFIRELELVVDCPDSFDYRPEAIKNLKEMQKSVMADAVNKCTKIDEEIQSLQALEFKQPLAAESATEVGQ